MRLQSIVCMGLISLMMVVACGVGATAPNGSGDSESRMGPEERSRSRIESVKMDASSGMLLSSSAGHSYRRLVGTVHGIVETGENVRGLNAPVKYASQFELFVPADRPSSLVLVEVENRGNPISPGNFDDLPQIPALGPPLTAEWAAYTRVAHADVGFFLDGRRSWARVQWQTGIAEGIPSDAQGVGLVVLRDFGRLLAGGMGDALLAELGSGPFRDRILYGGSQSAWAVTTFVADGFNVDPAAPAQGVYPVAITLNGAGNWSALNVPTDRAQRPYVLPDAAPLGPERILTRPGTDPFLVDLVAWTDYYRLRAGLTAREPASAGIRRYDWPSAHGFRQLFPPDQLDAIVFGPRGSGCNNGQPVPLNPLDPRPYGRAVLAAVDRELVERRAERQPFRGLHLPPTTTFRLGPGPLVTDEDGQQVFNPLPGTDVPIPMTDDDGWPVGGVRFPEVELPLGRPAPPAIPHVGTSAITDICGNFGGYRPFTAGELRFRYGSKERYLEAYGQLFDALVGQGLLLQGERRRMLAAAADQYEAAP